MAGSARGRLWVKKTIRSALAHGGVPFLLAMRERRLRHPRVVLLVDVSHSVARAAGLFLLLCSGFGERLRRLEIHFFVDRMAEATEAVTAWSAGRAGMRAGGAAARERAPIRKGAWRRGAVPGAGVKPARGPGFAEIVSGLADLDPGAPSDYGRAFFHARERLARSGGRDTVLVILGDARSNRTDPLTWAFEEIASRCRRVIWLNPEPRSLWDTGDSIMSEYLPACDVVCEARDLAGLARGVREMLRSL